MTILLVLILLGYGVSLVLHMYDPDSTSFNSLVLYNNHNSIYTKAEIKDYNFMPHININLLNGIEKG